MRHGARRAERIQKVLANAGFGSRRQMEIWIAAGRITVNGKPAKLGDLVSGRERICIDGKPVQIRERGTDDAPLCLLYYEPGEELSRRRVPRGEEHAGIPPPPKNSRWLNVSTLAPNTSGLVLLTTDGQLNNRLTRRNVTIEREYAVRLLGEPRPDQVENLLEGVQLDEGLAKLEHFQERGGGGTNVWYDVVLRETRSRLLRPALNAVGLTVSRIIRLRYGPLALGRLRRGMSRPLTRAETVALYETAGLPPPAPSPAARKSTSTARRAADARRGAGRSRRPARKPRR